MKINYELKPYNEGLPIGTIVPLISNTLIMKGWLPCDGSEIPSKYVDLIHLLGSENTPNLIGRTLIGVGTDPKRENSNTPNPNFDEKVDFKQCSYGGEYRHQLTVDELPKHSHTINGGNFVEHYQSFPGAKGSDKPFKNEKRYEGDRLIERTDISGADHLHYNMAPYFAVHYIIYTGLPE